MRHATICRHQMGRTQERSRAPRLHHVEGQWIAEEVLS